MQEGTGSVRDVTPEALAEQPRCSVKAGTLVSTAGQGGGLSCGVWLGSARGRTGRRRAAKSRGFWKRAGSGPGYGLGRQGLTEGGVRGRSDRAWTGAVRGLGDQRQAPYLSTLEVGGWKDRPASRAVFCSFPSNFSLNLFFNNVDWITPKLYFGARTALNATWKTSSWHLSVSS